MILKIYKNIFLISSVLLYLTTYSLSEINSKEWGTRCSEDEKTCIAMIISEVKKNDKIQTIATAYVRIGSTTQKKMNLIDKDDQTYKLSEESKNISVLSVKLPLNVDLRKKPAIVIDNKKIGDLSFTHCNQKEGCVTNIVVNNNIINLLRKGKTMSVIPGIYGSNQNIKIEFSLKNFTKSYLKLTKK
tara:strand:+ start:436 stop:996 length:561 start_codon:yes stop_codon:yes gene_type:complete